MDVYGLTGGIGSGKSTVAGLLEEYGVPVVSADELSRIVVSPGSEGLREVAEEFGAGVIADDGTLDRGRLAGVVFADPARRRRLEEILHPRIRERFEQVLDALEKAGHEVAVYEVPLLFEKNLQGEMKAVMLVTAPEAVRVRRVCARDDVTETEVRARIAAQMPESQKRKRADYIIENDGNVDALRREVEFLLARFLRVSGVVKRGPANEEVEATPCAVPRDHSLPVATGAPSRAATQVPSGAPVRTGQTLPPPGDPSATPSAASTLVAGAASREIADNSGPIGVAAPPSTTMPSTPVVPIGDDPPSEETTMPPSRPPGAPVAKMDSDPATSPRPSIPEPDPTPPPSDTAPQTPEPEPPTETVPSLKKPPTAPPLRRPTEARAKTPAGPKPPAKPPKRTKKSTSDLEKKPAAPPLAKPPAVSGGTAKQTVVGTAPPPPPPPARPKTERVPPVAAPPPTPAPDEEPA